MTDDTTPHDIDEETFRELTDGLVRRSSGEGVDVYDNAAGVGCPNPDCDRGTFRRLFVNEGPWGQLRITREGLDLCLTSVNDRRLVFVHDD